MGQVFLDDSRLGLCEWSLRGGVLSGEQGEQVANIDACHVPVELCRLCLGERLPLVMAEHGAVGGDERVGA